METHSIADVQDTVILERRGVDDNMDLGRLGVRRFIAAFLGRSCRQPAV
jgi:hypothetical protein